MKSYGVLFLLLILWCAFVPTLAVGPKSPVYAAVDEPSAENNLEEDTTEADISIPASDKEITVYTESTNTKRIMPLENYVASALSAVMPDNSPPEALKAQAVAIRSVALHNLHSPRHDGYDVCGNHLHCCPVADTPRADCMEATAATAGEVLYYDSAPALALSHLSSCICTEAYGEEYPYLVSVKVRDEKEFLCYKTVYTYTREEFISAFADYAVDFSQSMGEWVQDNTFTSGNRVKTVRVGGVNFKGSTFAALLNIDSLCFTVNAYEDKIEVICYGSGSGFGMSRMSAVIMANEGLGYAEILKYFYPQTVLMAN